MTTKTDKEVLIAVKVPEDAELVSIDLSRIEYRYAGDYVDTVDFTSDYRIVPPARAVGDEVSVRRETIEEVIEVMECNDHLQPVLGELRALLAAPPAQARPCQHTRITSQKGYPQNGEQPRWTCLDCGADVTQARPVVPEGWRPVPIRSLERLFMYIDPEPIQLPTGEVMAFKNPNAAEVLTKLSAEIRTMLKAIPAVRE